MKLFYSLLLLTLFVFLMILTVVFLKLSTLENRMESLATVRNVQEQIQDLKETQDVLRFEYHKNSAHLSERIDSLETGVAEQQPHGPKTPGFVLAELERQIHLKKGAQYVPEDEMAAQKKIDAAVSDLEKMEREQGEVVPRLMERIRVSRDPYIRAYLIRDVSWRLGPSAVSGLMELFRDKTFTSNLRVLAAHAALKAGGDEAGLLAEFTAHLGDPEEYLTIKTGLVPIFRDHPFEKAVDLLIDGARNPGYPPQHRTDCLLALARYDHPKVLKALEAILMEAEEDPLIKNLSIQAYHGIMQEKAVPFFRRLLETEGIDPKNRSKIEAILDRYPEG